MCILVVDDEPVVLRVATIWLKQAGYHLLTAESVETAIEACQQMGPIDVLLLDGDLPRMADGRTLREVLRISRPRLRVIIMSGWSYEALEERGLVARSDIFLPKPFTSQQLLKAVQAALEGPEVQGQE